MTRQYLTFTLIVTFSWLVASSGFAQDPVMIDFEDENLDVWDFVDEDSQNLGRPRSIHMGDSPQ